MDPILQEYENIVGIKDILTIVEQLEYTKHSRTFFTDTANALQILNFDTKTKILKENTETPEEKVVEIDKGTYGKIYKSNNAKIVYKEIIYKETNIDDLESNIRELFLELFIQNILSHDPEYGNFICKVYRLYRSEPTKDTPLRLFIKMEYVAESFQYHMAQYTQNLPIADFLQCIEVLCIILEGLRKNYSFYHRDLHTENIMFHNQSLKLIDFSFSTIEWRGKRYSLPSNTKHTPASNDMLIFIASFLHRYEGALENIEGIQFLESLFLTYKNTNLYEYWAEQTKCPIYHMFYDWMIQSHWPHWLQQEMEQSRNLFEPEYIREKCTKEGKYSLV